MKQSNCVLKGVKITLFLIYTSLIDFNLPGMNIGTQSIPAGFTFLYLTIDNYIKCFLIM